MKNLCIHTITTKGWDFATACEAYSKAGITGISIWQDAIEQLSVQETRQILQDSNLEVVSYVRGGFFAHASATERAKAIDQNKQMIDEAAEISAPSLVLVCGADPGQSLERSRGQIRDGIEAIVPHAAQRGVKLSIEPLHPMYAGARSAINSMASANEMAEKIDSPWVGIAIDVYHVWWEPNLQNEIARCGNNNNLFAYHICDWKVPTEHLLLDRGLMGEGCIPIQQITNWVTEAGFNGYEEVEIFSTKYWEMDQQTWLNMIIMAYADLK
ncbi:MAG: sugar phosphate isomerase/epimerase family protein [Bacteroidota bacterium]